MQYYKMYLQSELERRCQKNARYSLRAFAKHLDIDVTLLSRILANKRSISVATADRILSKLSASIKQRQMFLRSLAEEKVSVPDQGDIKRAAKKISQTEFSEITNWYHYAILELACIPTFVVEPKTVAKTLGIGHVEAKFAIDRLIHLGLLNEIDGRLFKTSEQVTTTDRKQTTIDLIKYHEQILELSKVAIRERKLADRGVFGITNYRLYWFDLQRSRQMEITPMIPHHWNFAVLGNDIYHLFPGTLSLTKLP